jgi:hypothetical protein
MYLFRCQDSAIRVFAHRIDINIYRYIYAYKYEYMYIHICTAAQIYTYKYLFRCQYGAMYIKIYIYIYTYINTSSGASMVLFVFSLIGLISSRDKEGKAASGPDPNIRASDTTGLGVKWK